MNEIVIKEATPADAELIADMSRTTFVESFGADNKKENLDKFLNETFTQERLIKEVGAPGNIFLLAYYGDEAIAYARLRDASNPLLAEGRQTLEIARLYASKQSIGKGVGSALMQRCIAIAKAKQVPVIWLGVWEKNERAIAFYTKWGFEKFSEHIFMLGDDPQTDWLMKKTL